MDQTINQSVDQAINVKVKAWADRLAKALNEDNDEYKKKFIIDRDSLKDLSELMDDLADIDQKFGII